MVLAVLMVLALLTFLTTQIDAFREGLGVFVDGALRDSLRSCCTVADLQLLLCGRGLREGALHLLLEILDLAFQRRARLGTAAHARRERCPAALERHAARGDVRVVRAFADQHDVGRRVAEAAGKRHLVRVRHHLRLPHEEVRVA